MAKHTATDKTARVIKTPIVLLSPVFGTFVVFSVDTLVPADRTAGLFDGVVGFSVGVLGRVGSLGFGLSGLPGSIGSLGSGCSVPQYLQLMEPIVSAPLVTPSQKRYAGRCPFTVYDASAIAKPSLFEVVSTPAAGKTWTI